MPGVEGRIDHLNADVKGQRLFVAALGNNTLEVLDLAQGKRIRSVIGLREPQGVAYVAELDQVGRQCRPSNRSKKSLPEPNGLSTKAPSNAHCRDG